MDPITGALIGGVISGLGSIFADIGKTKRLREAANKIDPELFGKLVDAYGNSEEAKAAAVAGPERAYDINKEIGDYGTRFDANVNPLIKRSLAQTGRGAIQSGFASGAGGSGRAAALTAGAYSDVAAKFGAAKQSGEDQLASQLRGLNAQERQFIVNTILGGRYKGQAAGLGIGEAKSRAQQQQAAILAGGSSPGETAATGLGTGLSGFSNFYNLLMQGAKPKIPVAAPA